MYYCTTTHLVILYEPSLCDVDVDVGDASDMSESVNLPVYAIVGVCAGVWTYVRDKVWVDGWEAFQIRKFLARNAKRGLVRIDSNFKARELKPIGLNQIGLNQNPIPMSAHRVRARRRERHRHEEGEREQAQAQAQENTKQASGDRARERLILYLAIFSRLLTLGLMVFHDVVFRDLSTSAHLQWYPCGGGGGGGGGGGASDTVAPPMSSSSSSSSSSS